MKRATTWLVTVAAVALLFGVASPEARAIPLSETGIWIEINDTDGDAGIQIFLDGEGWDMMRVYDPNGNMVLNFVGTGSVGEQGITELFFESAEPSFEEQPLEDLLELFPEGWYRFVGMTTDGQVLRDKARLTHALPAAPLLVSPAEDEEVDPENTVVSWQQVPDPPGSSIVGYHVVVEKEEGDALAFTADVGADVTSITVPPEFLIPGTAYKLEVLSIEASGNQTISERDFETE